MDALRAGIRKEWQFKSRIGRCDGFSYDSSPVDDDKRQPAIGVGEQLRLSAPAVITFQE